MRKKVFVSGFYLVYVTSNMSKNKNWTLYVGENGHFLIENI
jgi:hypothetical protein